MSTLAERRSARKEYERITKSSRPGGGNRFKAIVKIAKLGGAKNPEAVAASIGIRKYGKRQMNRWATARRSQNRKTR